MDSNINQQVVLYDVTRLVNRRRAAIPTGIDRIDVQLACAVFERFGEGCLPVVQCGSQTVVLQAERPVITDLLNNLKSVWFGNGKLSVKLAKRLDWLGISSNYGTGSRKVEKAGRKHLSATQHLLLRLRLAAMMLVRKLKIILRAASKPDAIRTKHIVYVNASHQGVIRYNQALFRMAGKARLDAVCYIHDIMPVELPEYSRDNQGEVMQMFLLELLRLHPDFVVNSKATANSLFDFLSAKTASGDTTEIAIEFPHIVYPGVDKVEHDSCEKPVLSGGNDKPAVFVMLGTIEPRKNHLMILHIWRELVRENFIPMPHLHIIGRRGWQVENVVAMLERCPSIRPYVKEFSDLDDQAVCRQLKSCRALLFPSFAEGLGLPLIEASQAGVPVIASDLPVFKELVADGGIFISPTNALSWKKAIERATQSDIKLPVVKLNPQLAGWQQQNRKFVDIVEEKLQLP